MIKISILAENTVPTSFGLTAEHGFSALIETPEAKLLFDTGQSGAAVDNALTMGKDLKKINAVVLSHGHYDHANGLEKVLKQIGRKVPVLGHPNIFEKKYVLNDEIKKYIGLKNNRAYLQDYLQADFELKAGGQEIAPNVYLTGEVPFSNDFEKIPKALQREVNGKFEQDTFIDENSLVIDTPIGLIIILGCAHRGMVNICSYASKKLKKNIRAIIGGTHLHDAAGEHFNFVKNFIAEQKLELFAPAHCTGSKRIFELEKLFPDITKPAHCGTVFEFN